MPTSRGIALVLGGLLAWASTGSAGEDRWQQSYELEAKGRYEQAAALIEPLTQAGAHREFALLRYGWLLYRQGLFRDAERAYRRALEVNPRSIDARLGLSLPLLAQQRWREAASVLDQVLALSPAHPVASIRRMLCAAGLRRWRELEARATEYTMRYPSAIDGWVFLARARAQLGDTAGAGQAYAAVLVRMPGHLEALRYLHRR